MKYNLYALMENSWDRKASQEKCKPGPSLALVLLSTVHGHNDVNAVFYVSASFQSHEWLGWVYSAGRKR